MRKYLLLLVLLWPALASAQQPFNLTQILGAAPSASNPLPSCIVSFGGSACITIPDSQVQDYDSDSGTDNTEIFGIAIPSTSGAVGVDSNNPLPIAISSSGNAVNVSQVGGLSVAYNPCADPSKLTWLNLNATAASGSTEHVAVNGSDRIYLCGYSLHLGGAGEVTIQFGSGSTCGSNTSNIRTIPAGAAADGEALDLLTPARSDTGRALCTNRSASTTLEGGFFYVREP